MVSSRLFILVTGLPGAGKSLVAKVARELGLPVLVMGDVVREEVRRLGLEPTTENLNKVARMLREKYGKTVIAERVVEKALGLKSPVVVIDGVRSLDEVKVFEKHGRVVIVAVHASPRTRYERLRRRGRECDPRSWEEFVSRDMTELGFGIGNVIALADFMIVNEGELEDVVREARRVLERCIRLGEDKSRGGG